LNTPDPADEIHNARLISELIKQGGFELKDRNQLREKILIELRELLSAWAVEYIRRKRSETVSAAAACQIIPFGSFCLGVHTAESDIDVLCVTPKHISRNDFFSEIPQLLAGCEKVDRSTLLSVPDAFVPVIKFQYSGIDIDLSVARLAYSLLPENFSVADDEHLVELTDPKDVTCLNGPRVTIEILRRVPDVKQFRTLLRSVKLWARRHGIYSNMVGFPGGVAWAIMAAHVCQLYPKMNAWMLLEKFFFCYKAWAFSNPIQIAPLEDCRLPPHSHFQAYAHMAEWDPAKLAAVNRRPMSVITPTYPAANATYNSSKSTVAIIKQEVDSSFALIIKGSEGIGALFEQVKFFRLYKNFLEVQLIGYPAVMKSFCTYINSQLRKFIERLHYFSECGGPGSNFLELAHPCTDYFSPAAQDRPREWGEGQERGFFFIGLKFNDEVVKKMREEKKQVNLTAPTQDFLGGLDHFDGAEISIKVVKKKDIPEWARALANDSGRAAVKRSASAAEGDAGAGDADGSGKAAADGKRRLSGKRCDEYASRPQGLADE